ncbi:MAG TPA: TonB-dependent receptor [Gammaproteobacteria bacterium]|nr:TonB-dependent receptor [Gammaproteobacteria bacterium]
MTALAGAIAFALGAPLQISHAQERTDQAAGPEEIVVTGSRIRQREDYASPNPVSTFDSAKMENLALVNIADVITQVPQNVSQFQASTTGGGAFFVGSTLANLRGLNPFFGTRTLTLVDSRRFIPTTQGDSVDLNFIPSILIDRTEVVTGGASAAYGSGAVSGVVNILLNRSLDGVKLDLDFGSTGQGDGDNYHVGIAGGSKFAGERGHFVVGGEYQQNDVIQSCSDARDWCSQGVGLFSNNTGFSFGAGQPYTPKIPGQPADIIMANLRQNQTTRNGVIFNNTQNATVAQQFNDAGTGITPFAIGAEGWRGAGGTVPGGDGQSTYKNLSLYPDIERKSVYGMLDWNFSDSLTGYVDLSWGNVTGINHQWAPGQNTANTCIRPDNAYLGTLSPAAQAEIAARNGNSPFSTNVLCGFTFNGFPLSPPGTIVTKDWSGQNDQTVTTDTDVTRIVLGLKGDLSETWSWDAYYQHGETTRDQIGSGYQTNWRYYMATDAIIDTRPGLPTTGQPICRAIVAGVPDPTVDPSLIAGCQPLNIFGQKASQAALDYAFGDLTESNKINQDVYAGTISGQLWKGWGAGALMGAFGLEYRDEDLVNNAGDLPRAQRTDFSLQYGDSFKGDTTVKEAFAEFEMPMLRDLPGAQLLTLNVAGRRSEYNNHDGTTGQSGTQSFDTWKAAFVYDPVKWFRLRGSRSQDLRAASFRELYYSQSIPPGGIFGYVQNPTTGLPPNTYPPQGDAAWQILVGNPQLNPEESLTETYGFVLSPGGGAEGMHFTADWYQITIKGGQRLDGSPSVINACFARNDPAACARIKYGPPLVPGFPTSNIDEVSVPYINASPYTAKGVDYSFDYPLMLDAGTIAFNLTATRAIDLLFQDTISLQIRDVAGQSGGGFGFLPDVAPAPEYIGNLIVSYLRDRFSITGQARYTGSGKLDLLTPRTGPSDPGYDPNLTGSVSNSDVPSHTTFNLSGSYDLKVGNIQRMELFGSITNVFDKDPPFSGNNGFGVGGVNAAFFDTLGRQYRVGVRMTF